jgi:multidrug transporter EmrE-like cation transporter
MRPPGKKSGLMKRQIMEYWWLILISVTAGVAGQTAIKLGVSQPGASDAAGNIGTLVGMIFASPLVLLGLLLYGMGAVAWIAVLARLDLSLAYPFLALNFVLVALVSRFALGETLPPLRWAGIVVICLGILLVARSSLE